MENHTDDGAHAPLTGRVLAASLESTTKGDTMIEAKGLTKRYGDDYAVRDLTFTVRPGVVTGFLGPNGAGKSTTMRVILGLDQPTAGRALVGGRRYDGLVRPLREVGSLLDASALHAGRTAWAHLRSIAQSNGIGRSRVEASFQPAVVSFTVSGPGSGLTHGPWPVRKARTRPGSHASISGVELL